MYDLSLRLDKPQLRSMVKGPQSAVFQDLIGRRRWHDCPLVCPWLQMEVPKSVDLQPLLALNPTYALSQRPSRPTRPNPSRPTSLCPTQTGTKPVASTDLDGRFRHRNHIAAPAHRMHAGPSIEDRPIELPPGQIKRLGCDYSVGA